MRRLLYYCLALVILIALSASPYAQSLRIGGFLSSIAKSGSTGLVGDVTLSEGSGVTLTQVGQNIAIAATGGGSGTVTSVGWTGGIVSVATATTTPAFTIAGTSGGIPYFSASNTWASSAALTANLPVIGGGAGVAPSVGTRSGNTTRFVSMDASTPATNDCAKFDANLNLTTSGAACGGGGGSTFYKARISRTAAQSIPDNTVTAITFDTEACTTCTDPSNLHDNSTNNERFTIPAAAFCTVGGSVSFASNTGGAFRSLYIYLNGSGGTLLDNQQQMNGSGSNQFANGSVPVSIVTSFHAAANDYVELHAFQNSGGALNINQGAVYTPIFWINCVAD